VCALILFLKTYLRVDRDGHTCAVTRSLRDSVSELFERSYICEPASEASRQEEWGEEM